MGRRVASAVGVAAVVIPVFRVRRPRRWTLCEPPDRMVAGSSCADDLGDCHGGELTRIGVENRHG